jgi:hypothetical protein
MSRQAVQEGVMTNSDHEQQSHEQSPQPAQQARVSAWRQWRLWAVLAAVPVAAVTAALVAPHASNGSGSGANIYGQSAAAASGTPQSHPAVTKKLAPARTPEQQVVSVRVPPKLAAALRKWDAGRGGKILTKVSSDIGVAVQSGGVKMYVQMKSACASLESVLSEAKAGPPIRDADAQKNYMTAVGELAKAAADCRSAISEQPYGDESVHTEENPTVLHRAENEFTVGIKDLYGLTYEIAAANKA